MSFCLKCGKENLEDARFCIHCGADLREYKVEISPKIEVSPNISISMIDIEQISLLVDDRLSKALEKAHTFKDIYVREFTPKEQQAIDTLLKMEREGVVDLSRYDPQVLEICAEFLDKASEVSHEIKGKEVFWNAKSTVLLGLGKYAEALECLNKLLEINPLIDAGWYNKGVVLEGLKRYDEAMHCFDRALEINPKYDLAWVEKGVVIYRQLKEFVGKLLERRMSKEELELFVSKQPELEEEVRRYINKALEINPQFEWAWILKSIFEKDRNEQIRCIDKALEINPGSANALYQKGVVKLASAEDLIDLKDFTIEKGKLPEYKSRLWATIEFYDKALKIDPNYTKALREKEELLKELRKLP
jgi:tetratricopeptide (TPR) repeat protein